MLKEGGLLDKVFASEKLFKAAHVSIVAPVMGATRGAGERDPIASGKVDMTDALLAQVSSSVVSASPANIDAGVKKVKKKFTGENIFAAFGEEHKPDSVKDSEPSSKSMNVRRHWKSDLDMKRWQKDLGDSARLDKLYIENCYNANPEFGASQSELALQHNAMYRQRASMAKERSGGDQADASTELRKIAQLLAPKSKKSKKAKAVNFMKDMGGGGMGLSMGFGKPKEPPPESAKPIDEQEAYQSPLNPIAEVFLEDEEVARDASKGALGDSRSFDRSLDFSVESDPFSTAQNTSSVAGATSMGFFRASPSGKGKGRSASKQASLEKVRQRLPEMPKTISLLLYKNGDKHHTGDPVFLNRRPKDLRELLVACGNGCSVCIGPAEAIFDKHMQQIREVREVEGGGIFLLKGKEGLDPPQGFAIAHKSRIPAGGNESFKKLASFQVANASAGHIDHDSNAANARSMGMSKSMPSFRDKPVSDSPIYGEFMQAGRLPSLSAASVYSAGVQSGVQSGKSSTRQLDGQTVSERLDAESYRVIKGLGGTVGTWTARDRDYSMWPPGPALSGRSRFAGGMGSTQ